MRARASAPPVLALALIVGAIFLPDPSEAPRAPRPVAVSQTAYACPSDVTVGAGQVAPAKSVSAIGLPKGGRVSALDGTNSWRVATTTAPTIVRQFGRGSGPVGFFAATTEDGKALSVASCPPTVDESWFIGLGSSDKHTSIVQLTNLSDVLAVADISLWGTAGPIEAVGGDGIVLEPQESRLINVSDLATGESEVAVRVERRRGAFSVTAFDGSTGVFGGADVQAPTRAPRRDQVVGGLPAALHQRTLLVANPATTTSRLSVSVMGPRGTFVPKELAAVRVPAGRVTALTLPASVGSDGASIRLVSEQPVAAVVRVAEGKTDYAYVGSVHSLDGPAVLPVDLGSGTGRPRLTVSAPRGKASVTVTGFDAGMKQLGKESVDVRAGATVNISLAQLTDSDQLAYVVVRPKGEVVGSALFRKDDGVAAIPLEAAPVRVLGPAVRYIG